MKNKNKPVEKTEDVIILSPEMEEELSELNKELEERYKLLAEIGVKSIEQYNIIAKNSSAFFYIFTKKSTLKC